MKIESIDVLKAKEQLDLQEATRRDDVFNQLLVINEQLTNLSVFPSLCWAWCFDIIKDIFDNNAEVGYDEAIAEGVTLKQIFDKFYEDCDSLGLSLDHGGEILEETIRDWMRENDFIVALDDDGWLDD
jgi:hypothetical protein